MSLFGVLRGLSFFFWGGGLGIDHIFGEYLQSLGAGGGTREMPFLGSLQICCLKKTIVQTP